MRLYCHRCKRQVNAVLASAQPFEWFTSGADYICPKCGRQIMYYASHARWPPIRVVKRYYLGLGVLMIVIGVSFWLGSMLTYGSMERLLEVSAYSFSVAGAVIMVYSLVLLAKLMRRKRRGGFPSLMNTNRITEKQENYVKILSSYEYSKKKDERDIEDYLKKHGKNSVSKLSKREASEMIGILLQRPTEYTFACGEKAILHKREVNSYYVLGDFEGCLHACPRGIDVNDCSFWKEHL